MIPEKKQWVSELNNLQEWNRSMIDLYEVKIKASNSIVMQIKDYKRLKKKVVKLIFDLDLSTV